MHLEATAGFSHEFCGCRIAETCHLADIGYAEKALMFAPFLGSSAFLVGSR